MEADTKQIICPEHGNHKATLFCYPHKYAGIWECGDISDSHEHDPETYEIVDTVHDHLGFNGHYQTEGKAYVCGGAEGCGVYIEDADPEIDRLEALAEMSYDCD